MSELYIPREKPTRNLLNGRFLPGHVPHNKGKKWEEYMDMRKAKRVKQIGMKNLVPNMLLGGWNARAVVAIDDDNRLAGIYPSSEEASRKSGIIARNIRLCCDKKRKHAGGYRWFWEDDNEWCDVVNGNV